MADPNVVMPLAEPEIRLTVKSAVPEMLPAAVTDPEALIEVA